MVPSLGELLADAVERRLVVLDGAGNQIFHRGVQDGGDTDRLVDPGKNLLRNPALKGVKADPRLFRYPVLGGILLFYLPFNVFP